VARARVICHRRIRVIQQLSAGGETVLTGLLADRSALFGVLAQFEALGLELLELRQIRARPTSPESGDNRSPHGVRC
jgi:hypothetical protein